MTLPKKSGNDAEKSISFHFGGHDHFILISSFQVPRFPRPVEWHFVLGCFVHRLLLAAYRGDIMWWHFSKSARFRNSSFPQKIRRRSRAAQAPHQAIESLEPRTLLSGTYNLNSISSFTFNPLGANPQAPLIIDGSGDLFGTTTQGGTSNAGTVFEIASGSNTITTLTSFNGTNGGQPVGALLMDSSGNLFGTTQLGGASDEGTVFEIVHGASSITTLASFNGVNGQQPAGGLVMDSNGNLFGTTQQGGLANDGTVFEIVHGSSTIVTVASFNGANGQNPSAGLTIDSSGNLFGTTQQGGLAGDGAVFEIVHGSSTIVTVTSFNGSNGQNPFAGLALDTNGDLFGTTVRGGGFGNGEVFEIVRGTSAITVLASFNVANGVNPIGGVILDAGGNLFGTAQLGGSGGEGTVFEIANGSGTITSLASFNGANGRMPSAGLAIDGGGNLYGTTLFGGPFDEGTVFEFSRGGSALTTLASFDSTSNGEDPTDLTIDAGGNLFGTTELGGDFNDGTVFEILHGSTTITTLASFNGANGVNPAAGLVLDRSGDLFGTTSGGGDLGVGTVFEIVHGTGTITTLASFNAQNGEVPSAPLTIDGSGNLFGVTPFGGLFGEGTVFEIASGSSAITTLVSFSGPNGQSPFGAVVLDNSGDLFGTTLSGGSSGEGTVFEIANGSSTITTLASFSGANGANPIGALLMDASGDLFGTTSGGGALGDGTVFELAAGASAVTTLASFNGADGQTPTAGVVMDSSGDLIGTASQGGASGNGTAFEIINGSNTITTLASFSGSNGANPSSGLAMDAGGDIFGTTAAGGFSGLGAVFELSTPSQLVFSASPGIVTAGTLPSAAITIEDANGNVESSDSAGVTLSVYDSTGANLLGTQTVNAVNGVATFNFGTLPVSVIDTAGSYVLKAGDLADGLNSSNSPTYQVSPAAATQLVFTTQPTDGAAGAVLQPVAVAIEDAFGNIETADNASSISIVANGPGSFSVQSTTSATVRSGVATFNNLSLKTHGTYTLTATDAGVGSVISGAFSIQSGSIASLVFVQEPTNAIAGHAIAPVTVQVLDTFGNPIAGQTITLISTGPGVIASGASAVSDSSGTATFNSIILNTPGTYTLVAHDGAFASPSTSFAVAPQLVFTQQPTSEIAGRITPPVMVAIEDGLGNVIATDNSTITLSLFSGPGIINNGATATARRGIATFGGLTLKTAGADVLQATDTANGGSGLSNAFTVSPDAPAELSIVQDPVGATAGSLVSPILVNVLDRFGNLVTTDTSTVTLSIRNGPLNGVLLGMTTATVSGGVATFGNVTIDAAGTYSLSVTDGLLDDDHTANFKITHAAASIMTILQQPSDVVAGVRMFPSMAVSITDAFGNAINGTSVSLSIASGPPGAVLFGNPSVNTNAFGVATFGNVSLRQAGVYTLSVSNDGLAPLTTGRFTVFPADPSKLVFTTVPVAVSHGSTFTVAVSVVDAFGNLVSGLNAGSISLTLGDHPRGSVLNGPLTANITNGTATFTSLSVNLAGTYTLKATDNLGVSGATLPSLIVS